jgi:hypothetical protein
MAKVKVRVWQGTVGRYMAGWPMTNVDEAVRIWGKVGVQVIPDPQVRMVNLSEVPAETSPADATAQIVKELTEPINKAIREQGDDPHLDVVVLPLLGAWGQAYTPLTPMGPKTAGRFAPFDGPVAIVTNGVAVIADKSLANRRDQAWPLGPDAPPDNNPLMAVAAGNDLAHEMGHLFGLWHTTHEGRPGRPTIKAVPRQIQYLIHETMYNQSAMLQNSQEKRTRTEDEVRLMLATNSPGSERVMLGRNQDWYIGLRGEEIDPSDVKIVHENIESGRYLTGG